MTNAPPKLSTLIGMAVLLAVSALAFAKGGSKPGLPAPATVTSSAGCTSLDTTWAPVIGADKYAIEVTVEYDSQSTDCANAPDTTFVFSFTSATPNISIDYGAFAEDFGNGTQGPCAFTNVQVKALNPPGKGAVSQNNPFTSAEPIDNRGSCGT